MPRIKLQEQSQYEFYYEVTLQPRDINYGGHMGNDTLISLINAARTNLFRSLGCSETDLGDGKTGIIMADLVVNYKGEAFLFDVLRIDSHIGEMGRNGFRIYHRVTKEGKILALVETGLASFEYGSRKIVSIPTTFIHALENG
jgi:acyl-CoA thioester hydrolase